jgi:hypothetical protein
MEKLCHGVSMQTTDMAEINIAASGKMPGVRRSKKLSTRVDLTPMVDLGFLLITFFVFTTTMATPKALKLIMPKDSKVPTKVKESTALTIFPLKNGKIVYYHGTVENPIYGITSFSYSDGIGKIIRDKKAALETQEKGLSKELFLIIKPTDESSVRQITDLMDEVLINNLKHYAITDIVKEEKELIIKLNGSL